MKEPKLTKEEWIEMWRLMLRDNEFLNRLSEIKKKYYKGNDN